MAAHAEFDLILGGTLIAQYDPKGEFDDATAIANTFISYEPLRMLSFKFTKAP